MFDDMRDMTPEELYFVYDLNILRSAATFFKIKGRSKMNKIVLCLNLESYFKEESK